MTLDEAYALFGKPTAYADPKTVTVNRSGATWTGKLIGVVAHPSLVIEDADGQRCVIALNGATATNQEDSSA